MVVKQTLQGLVNNDMGHLEKVEAFYNTDAEGFDDKIRKSGWLGSQVLRKTLQNTPYAVRRMLDLGAGTGNTIAVVRETVQPQEIVAVDISEGMLSHLREKYPDDPRITVARTAVQDYLAGTSNHFDLITAMALFHHLPDQAAVVAGISSRLEDGGQAMFTYDPVIHGHPIQENALTDVEEVEAIYRISPGEMEEEVRSNGLTVKHHELYVARPNESSYVGGFIVAKKSE